MLRAGDTLVVRWVDRLGRNYADVTDTIREFIRRGVIVRTVINGLTFDGATKDPMQQAVRDSLIAFMAATAQSQAEVIKEAQKAGIAHAQTHDDGTQISGTETDVQFGAIPIGPRPPASRNSNLSNRADHWSETAIHLQDSIEAGTTVGSRSGMVSDQSQRLEYFLTFHVAKFQKSFAPGFPWSQHDPNSGSCF